MGHIHLGVIPRTKPWKEVVSLLEVGADVEEVAEASARAAERALLSASVDPVFVEAVRLLVSIPIAARSKDFGDALRQLAEGARLPSNLLQSKQYREFMVLPGRKEKIALPPETANNSSSLSNSISYVAHSPWWSTSSSHDMFGFIAKLPTLLVVTGNSSPILF